MSISQSKLCNLHLNLMIKINYEPLAQVDYVTYLGGTVSRIAKIDKKLTKQMGKASAAFDKLQQRLWYNMHVSTVAKCK